MKRLKVGFIGLGHVTQVCHLPGYKNVDNIRVVAGAELKRDVLARVSVEYDFKGYLKYSDMLENEDLDIICVTTGPRHTKRIIEDVARHGVNVLVEKPMALNLEDAVAIIRICEENNVQLCYGETFRYFPTFSRGKELIEEGCIGEPNLLLEFTVGGNGLDGFQPYNIYEPGDPGLGPLGLMDHGIHLVDAFSWLINSDVEWVFGRGNRFGSPPCTEFLSMGFRNGALGQLLYNEATFPSDLPNEGIFSWGSYFANGVPSWENNPSNVRIHGSDGALRIFPYANKLFFFSKKGVKQIRVEDEPHPKHFGLQIKSFAERLLNNEEPEVTGKDGFKSLQVILAAYESFETKKVIEIQPFQL
jgi:predicted dehydrogenase